MKAADIMTQTVITVSPETPVAEIARTMLERGVSALPVLDGERVVGIVSEGDLLRRVEHGDQERTSWWLRHFGPIEKLADQYRRAYGRVAREVMSSPIIAVREDTPVSEIARLLETRRIKRVPVISDGRLVGIVSRANLLQAVAAGGEPSIPGPSASDADLRRLVLGNIKRHPWAGEMTLNVTVTDGVAELWGLVVNESQRTAVRVAAERTEGVRSVEDHLQIFDPRAVRPG
jgi:CBS domain-containing protein